MRYLTLRAEDDELQGPILDPDAIRRSVKWRDVLRFHVGEPLRKALDEPPMPSVLPRARRVGAPDDEDTEPAIGQWESPRLSEAQCEIVVRVCVLLGAGRLRAYGRRAGPGGVWEWIPRAEWQRVTAIEPNVTPWLALFQPLADTFVLHSGEPAWCCVAVVPSLRDEAYGDLPPVPPREAWPGWVLARHDQIADQCQGDGDAAKSIAAIQCRKWLKDVERLHGTTKPRSKLWFRTEAKRCWPILEDSRFDRTWADMPPQWLAPGKLPDSRKELPVPACDQFVRGER
jgi:hypothetical protein